jgi:hypothetical protein
MVPKSIENSYNVIYKDFVTIREVSKKFALVPKITRNGRFREKNKIRTRLAQRPTLVVLCLKLWSVRGEGTVRVTKYVILASV